MAKSKKKAKTINSKTDEQNSREIIQSYKNGFIREKINERQKDLDVILKHVEINSDRLQELLENQRIIVDDLLKKTNENRKKGYFLSPDENINQVSNEDVISALIKKWKIVKSEEESIIEINEKICNNNTKIVQIKEKVVYWQEFINTGNNKQKNIIKSFKKQLIEINTFFDEMANKIKESTENIDVEYEQMSLDNSKNEKKKAVDNVMALVNDTTVSLLKDNDWLKIQDETQNNIVNRLLVEIEDLELENITMNETINKVNLLNLNMERDDKMYIFRDKQPLDSNLVMDSDINRISELVDVNKNDPQNYLPYLNYLSGIPNQCSNNYLSKPEKLEPLGDLEMATLHVVGEKKQIYESQVEETNSNISNPDYSSSLDSLVTINSKQMYIR
ncbi:hypothetical protein A3Q56_01945 [Intoshia linei]|uniref:Coiled-coil domain-containing protein 83 n=1 Tax=Intoshia linei TaxID=1819745 RepID=A0A177B7K6_9BILA|nr:hypothetical protein A3Q56_01945 [Intoshia linei]